MRTLPTSILITGASRGIGAALARRFSAPGTRLLLIGRDAPRLAAVAEACKARGADAECEAADVADAATLAPMLARRDAERRFDLVVANAGVSAGRSIAGDLEPAEAAARVIRINLEGVVNTVAALAEAMRGRGRGQIALVSSLAGLLPLPDSPAYSASKAGVVSYGLALDALIRPAGVAVTVLCPGFVKSDMSDRYLGSKPFMLEAERAAEIMARAILARRRLVAFPWPLAFGVRAAALLPPALRPAALALSRFAIEPE